MDKPTNECVNVYHIESNKGAVSDGSSMRFGSKQSRKGGINQLPYQVVARCATLMLLKTEGSQEDSI